MDKALAITDLELTNMKEGKRKRKIHRKQEIEKAVYKEALTSKEV